MSAPNTTNYSWLKQQPAVGSTWSDNNQSDPSGDQVIPSPWPSSSTISFAPRLATNSAAFASQPNTVTSLSTEPHKSSGGLVDEHGSSHVSQRASPPSQLFGSSGLSTNRVERSTDKGLGHENESLKVSSSSSHTPSVSPFASLASFQPDSESPGSQASQKGSGQSASSSQQASHSSIFGAPLVFGQSTGPALQEGARTPGLTDLKGPPPFYAFAPSAKQPGNGQETIAPAYSPSPFASLISPSTTETFVKRTLQSTPALHKDAASPLNEKSRSESRPASTSVQSTSSISSARPAAASMQSDTDSNDSQSSGQQVKIESEPDTPKAATSTSTGRPPASVIESDSGSITAPAATITPPDNESRTTSAAAVECPEVQKEPSKSKPRSYGINDEDESDVGTSTTSLADSVATEDMRAQIVTDLDSDSRVLKSTSTFLVSEIGELAKQIQTLRQENERLLKLAENGAAMKSQMQKIMEENDCLTVKCDKMQNAFAIIDNESDLSVRTIAIYDCPHTVATVEDDLDFIMPEVIVIYSMHPSEGTLNGQKTILRTIKIKCASEAAAECIYYFLRWRTDYRDLKMAVTCSQARNSAAQATPGGDSASSSSTP
ncbi:hypothetical protein POJ06DRAFT_22217 [Lipomyces tetrasporus]|uniref:Uncharacterized protein n=1 Tax=Lipomyces tetrasporus TaxID=54092 RepID=A0AAD7VPG9_9ASCO|nr:uncharacterized protein POJ06DRAFT_22217 [Lipomyces tetrasporus]KAJ8097792.1 hypothetical protein POJ06DRAFT_22217 [Lipomyces tetrasporus]